MFAPPHIINYIKDSIPVYADWPVAGVQYKNTVELLKNPTAFGYSIDWFTTLGRTVGAQAIFAADARGFIWGSATARDLRLPMHVVRKPGKLPGQVWSQEYALEYGTDTLELGCIELNKDRPVLIIDDVLATGGTAEAICKLLHNNLGIDYSLMTVGILINLSFLGGDSKLTSMGVKVHGLIYE